SAGQTAGLSASIAVAAPQNGMFFSAGERVQLTVRFTNRCGRILHASQLGTANLYVAGPRTPASTKTAAKLLNCVTDRTVSDRQHHTIFLAHPHLADPSQNNLTEDTDGTLHYQLAPVTDEAAGTYTAGVWAKAVDEIDQDFALADLQIGTA